MSIEDPRGYNVSPLILLEQENLAQELRRLADLAESGEVVCVALRLFMADGTSEDIVVGGVSEEQRAEALARLQRRH